MDSPATAASTAAAAAKKRRGCYDQEQQQAGSSLEEPRPLPGLKLQSASYQRIWARADGLGSPQYVEALLSPGNRAYIKIRDLSPVGANPRPLYLCTELALDDSGVFVPSERGTVVVKAARLKPGEELESVIAGTSVPALRRGCDEPAEEAKAMALLTAAVGKGSQSGVVPLLDCFVDADRWLYMVLPFYVRGDLVEVLGGLGRKGQLGTPACVSWARSVFGRLVGSLAVLKEQGIGHMDISPENVFLDETGAMPALGDLGMALAAPVPVPTPAAGGDGASSPKRQPDEDEGPPRTPAKVATPTGAGDITGSRKKREREDAEAEDRARPSIIKQHTTLLTAQRFRGKIAYAAPELVLEQPFDPYATDVFSLGCLLFALLAGRLLMEPSSKRGEDVLANRPRFAALLRRDFATLFELQNSSFQLPAEAADLLKGMIDPNPRRRLTLEEVAEHPWVQGR